MNKKLVGLIVATGVILVLVIGVAVGGLRLKKDSPTEQVNKVVANTNDNRGSQTTPPRQTTKTPTREQETKPVQQQEDPIQDQEGVVNKVIENSQKVGGTTLQDGYTTAMRPSKAKLKEDVYEVTGVVKSLELVEDSHGLQAHFKVTLELQVGVDKLDIEYLTTINSLSSLKKGTPITLEYQVTDNSRIVVKSIKLKDK